MAVEIAIDVLSERGFFVNCDVRTAERAVSVDQRTGAIAYDSKKQCEFLRFLYIRICVFVWGCLCHTWSFHQRAGAIAYYQKAI